MPCAIKEQCVSILSSFVCVSHTHESSLAYCHDNGVVALLDLFNGLDKVLGVRQNFRRAIDFLYIGIITALVMSYHR